MLGKDIIEEAKRLYDADRKKRQRELRAEKDVGDVPPMSHDVPPMSHQCPAMSHDVPKCGNGNGNGIGISVFSLIDENKEIQAKKMSRTQKTQLVLPEIPEPLQKLSDFSDAWEDWQQHRREIRKPLTSQTAKEQLAKLTQVVDPIATIRHSIAGGWQGLFEPQPKPAQAPALQHQAKIIAPPKPVDYSFLKQYET
jgi:hypothetical protein